VGVCILTKNTNYWNAQAAWAGLRGLDAPVPLHARKNSVAAAKHNPTPWVLAAPRIHRRFFSPAEARAMQASRRFPTSHTGENSKAGNRLPRSLITKKAVRPPPLVAPRPIVASTSLPAPHTIMTALAQSRPENGAHPVPRPFSLLLR